MNPKRFLATIVLAAAAGLSGCSNQETPAQPAAIDMTEMKQNLQILARARVLFGHQSVGRDLLAGVEQLARDAGVALRIQRIEGTPPDDEPGLFHSEVGENRNPDSKCEVFEQLLDRPERPAYDLAMMKFCYVDLGRGSSAEADSMLRRYAATVERIRETRPDVQLVHLTLPLRAEPPGKKTRLKRLLGMEVDSDHDNALRNEFNRRLRETWADEPMFDLASVESTLPDGTRVTYEHDGQAMNMLAQAYTNDGGHLNELGQRHAAAEFVRVLADTLRRAPRQTDVEQLTQAAE